jgi:hypothetical protein
MKSRRIQNKKERRKKEIAKETCEKKEKNLRNLLL